MDKIYWRKPFYIFCFFNNEDITNEKKPIPTISLPSTKSATKGNKIKYYSGFKVIHGKN